MMKYFLTQIWASLINPYFYLSVIKAPLTRAIKYYLALSVILALFATLAVGLIWAPQLNNLIKTFGQEFVSNYPDDLIVNISEGRAEVNEPGVYFFPWPDDLSKISSAVDNFLVIDIDSGEEMAFADYRTLWLLEETELIQLANISSGDYQSQSLSGLPDIEITKIALVEMMDKFRSNLRLLPPLLAFLAFFFSLILFTFLFIHWLIMALPVWLLFKLFTLEGGYHEGLKVTLHASTFALIVWFIWLFIPGTLPGLWTLSILTLISATINLWYVKQYQEFLDKSRLKDS